MATYFAENVEEPAYSPRKRLNMRGLNVAIAMVNISAVDAIC